VKRIARRAFLKSAGTGALALGLPRLGLAASTGSNPSGVNDHVRIAVVGVGSKEAVGGVGGRGRQLINALGNVQGVRIVALCDVDQGILARQAGQLKDQGQPVVVYGDLRRVFDDKSVDAVVVATPNHWHALATVWACQAGKDVYVEKPMSHNIWEGRQMLAAARKGGRIVQAGTQARSSSVLREALHYDWHWVWSTGSGEMGNNGVHYIDMCRWVMKLDAPAPRVMSVGGRFNFDDDGETPNTQVAILDYQPAPIYCEIRGLPEKKGSEAMDSFQNTKVGVVLQCEGGYFAGAHLSGAAFDNRGKEIKKFGPTTWGDMDTGHLANFVEVTRSRKAGALRADVLEGHLSAACCHQISISHRLGQTAPPDTALERTKANPVLSDAVARYREHLRANEIDFAAKEILGPWLTFDTKQERFIGEFAAEANSLLKRAYRRPFVVPQIA
jgi:predicted dehydrogenase